MIQVIKLQFKILLKFYFLLERSYISSWFSLIVIDWNKQMSGSGGQESTEAAFKHSHPCYLHSVCEAIAACGSSTHSGP